jgi:hypothetical protein
MNVLRYITILVLSLFVTLAAASADSSATGEWSIEPSTQAGQVHFTIVLGNPDSSDTEDHSSDVDISALGLSKAQLESSGDVTFTFMREAGTFACRGRISNGKGGGTATFTPSGDYRSKMAALGYDGLTLRNQVTAAMIDLTTAYVASISAAGYPHLLFEELVAFRALGVDEGYARTMRATFSSQDLDANDLIAMRALHVTAGYVTELRAMGFTIDKPRDAIAMSALHVDAEYARSLAAAGYPHLTARELIQLRAMHIDAAYIQRVKSHGIPNPTVEQLVRLKAMNII